MKMKRDQHQSWLEKLVPYAFMFLNQVLLSFIVYRRLLSKFQAISDKQEKMSEKPKKSAKVQFADSAGNALSSERMIEGRSVFNDIELTEDETRILKSIDTSESNQSSQTSVSETLNNEIRVSRSRGKSM